jgi:predicted metal-dependent hydrolase
VHPPTGRVRIAAPTRMKLDTIRVYAISKLGWIRDQQAKLQKQDRETRREYIDRESHYLWGKRYLLQVREAERPPSVDLRHRRIVLQVRKGANEKRRRAIMEAWYRDQLRREALPLISDWQGRLGVKVERLLVQRMRTKWGSCNTRVGRIRLNTELAKKPRECLEYVIVHELLHLLERTHNARFVAMMDRHLPHWRQLRQQLNTEPLAHEEWTY